MQLVLTRTRRRATPPPVYPKTRGALGICHRRVHSPALRTPDSVTEWGRASAALRGYACVRASASASVSVSVSASVSVSVSVSVSASASASASSCVNVRAFVGGCGRDDARAREAERAARARARCVPVCATKAYGMLSPSMVVATGTVRCLGVWARDAGVGAASDVGTATEYEAAIGSSPIYNRGRAWRLSTAPGPSSSRTEAFLAGNVGV